MNDAVLTLAHSNDAAGLRVANLRKSYKKKIVIRDVSLRLDQGEVVARRGGIESAGVRFHGKSRCLTGWPMVYGNNNYCSHWD